MRRLIWKGFCETLQHRAESFYRLLRLRDPHLPGRGKHPSVEIAAEIDRYLRAEIVCIDDLHKNIFPEAVNDAVHQDVFAQQRYRTFLAVEHGKLLREELRYVKVLWLSYSSFVCDLHLNDAINAELCDPLPVIVKADKIVCIVVPEHGERGDRVNLSAVPKNLLFSVSVIEIAEGDFLPLRDGGLDAVYIQIDALVGGFGTAVDVETPFQKGCVAGSNKGRKPFN